MIFLIFPYQSNSLNKRKQTETILFANQSVIAISNKKIVLRLTSKDTVYYVYYACLDSGYETT